MIVTPRKRRVSWNDCNRLTRNWGSTSRLARGVWVEIMDTSERVEIAFCHASQEACELKFKFLFVNAVLDASRLARGVWVEISVTISGSPITWSRLARGVWVEIRRGWWIFPGTMSRLARGVWVEIEWNDAHTHTSKSRLARGVWVEIAVSLIFCPGSPVTPRMRRVSWNIKSASEDAQMKVTPRKRHVTCSFQKYKVLNSSCLDYSPLQIRVYNNK